MRKKYYDDAKENAAFERCVDVVTAQILKLLFTTLNDASFFTLNGGVFT